MVIITYTIEEDGFKIWDLNGKPTWACHPDFNNWYSYQDRDTHVNRFQA